MTLHTGPRNGDYAKYIDELTRHPAVNAASLVELTSVAARAQLNSASAISHLPPSTDAVNTNAKPDKKPDPLRPSRQPANRRRDSPGADSSTRPGAAHGATRSEITATSGNQTAPDLPGPRRIIGTLLRLAGYVLFFLAFRDALRILNLGVSSLESWVPVIALLIVGKMLLRAARAVFDPRVIAKNPEKSLPPHIEH